MCVATTLAFSLLQGISLTNAKIEPHLGFFPLVQARISSITDSRVSEQENAILNFCNQG